LTAPSFGGGWQGEIRWCSKANYANSCGVPYRHNAIDEGGDWRVGVCLDDGTEVVGEEIAITIGKSL
jgi:hypothetical protein